MKVIVNSKSGDYLNLAILGKNFKDNCVTFERCFSGNTNIAEMIPIEPETVTTVKINQSAIPKSLTGKAPVTKIFFFLPGESLRNFAK